MEFPVNLSEMVVFLISFIISSSFVFWFIYLYFLKTKKRYKSKKEMGKVYFVIDWIFFGIILLLSIFLMLFIGSTLSQKWQQVLVEICFVILPLMYFLIRTPMRIRKFYFPKFYYFQDISVFVSSKKRWKKFLQQTKINPELKNFRHHFDMDNCPYFDEISNNCSYSQKITLQHWAKENGLKFE